MIRPAVLAVALWAIVAAPALCAAGVLAHMCECEESAVCDHESGCETDPCSDLVVLRDGSQDGLQEADGSSAPAQLPVPARLEPHSPASRTAHSTSPGFPPAPGVPHASDLPLLI